MQSETSFSVAAPPTFNGENYEIWAIRMESYLEAADLWEAVEEDYDVPPLSDNPTMAQMKVHKEKKQREAKAKACLFTAVSPEVFTRIMMLKSANEIWDFLKKEYEANEKVKGMKVLMLIKEFEMQKMKESETVKEYSDRLLSNVNRIRLLGQEVDDSRIVQKILVTLPERFESTISSLENSRDVTTITLAELLSALQAQEQRRLMRQEGTIEGALQAKLQLNQRPEGKKMWKKEPESSGTDLGGKTSYPPCQHCEKTGHASFRCWRRPDVKCHKCSQFGHIAKICKSQEQRKEDEAQVVDQEDDQLFVVAYPATSNASES